jgi:hypothetical protein
MTRITQLPTVTTITDQGVFVVVDNGLTKKFAYSTLKNELIGAQGPTGPVGPPGDQGPAFTASQYDYQTLVTSPNVLNQLELIYDNVSRNIEAGYDSETGIFTAPKEGFYQVNASIGVNPFEEPNYYGGGLIGLLLNGDRIATGKFIDAGGITLGGTAIGVVDQSIISSLIFLNVGDTLQCELIYITDAPNGAWNTETTLAPNSFQACWLRGA